MALSKAWAVFRLALLDNSGASLGLSLHLSVLGKLLSSCTAWGQRDALIWNCPFPASCSSVGSVPSFIPALLCFPTSKMGIKQLSVQRSD